MKCLQSSPLLLIFFFGPAWVFGQKPTDDHTLKGSVFAKDGQIMFATIGLIGENIGTITDQNGNFELHIPDAHVMMKVSVSHIGYETLSLTIDSLLSLGEVAIELKERVYHFDEVVVTADRLKAKTKEYGNTQKHDLFIWIQDGDRGAEIVTFIDPKTEITLNSVSINILNPLEKEFTLLLNLYSVDETTQLPGRQLLTEQKIVESSMKKGWLEVDLTKENIVVDEPFFAGFQWVNVDEPLPLIGGKNSDSRKSLVRKKALGKWGIFAEWDIKVEGKSYRPR